MLEKANTRLINTDVNVCVVLDTRIDIEVLVQATEEEIQQELDEATQLAVEKTSRTTRTSA